MTTAVVGGVLGAALLAAIVVIVVLLRRGTHGVATGTYLKYLHSHITCVFDVDNWKRVIP